MYENQAIIDRVQREVESKMKKQLKEETES